MTIFNGFSISNLGMRAQVAALGVISANVANVQTGGFKRTDTQFQTVLSDRLFQQSDIGGTRPKMLPRNTIQGNLLPTGRPLDLAIIGDGFFITQPSFSGTGELLYSRDGSFSTRTVNDITVTDPRTGNTFQSNDSYIVDKNGNFVLGYPANADGTFRPTGTLGPMRVDRNAFIDPGIATSRAELRLNLNSNAEAITTDHLRAVSALDTAGRRAKDMEVLSVDFVDSNGKRQTARLNFTKADTNQWDLSATYNGGGSPQIDRIELLGSVVDVGDSYSVTVAGQTVSYTAVDGDTMSEIVSNLVTALNADPIVAATATAAAGTSPGVITLTGATAGETFTSSASASNGSGSAQVEEVTLGGTVDPGERFEVIIDGTTISYVVPPPPDVATLTDVANSLIASINANAVTGALVTATAGATAGSITLTGNIAGTSFGVVSVATADGTIDNSTTTAAVVATDDNTARSSTVYEAHSTLTTTPVTRLNFSGNGLLRSPESLSLDLSFPATELNPEGTATFDVDISNIHQYANPFLFQGYSENGFEVSSLNEVTFNKRGRVVGFFESGRTRELYEVPLAKFQNPDGLESRNGQLFAETTESGTPTVETAAVDGIATFTVGTQEISNVNLIDEFTAMIRTQKAYNSSANAFKTADEMLQTASQMKR